MEHNPDEHKEHIFETAVKRALNHLEEKHGTLPTNVKLCFEDEIGTISLLKKTKKQTKNTG